jgi:SPP1 gp7 family putative phage head morphogenesis protein
MLSQANERAVKWAEQRAGELIKGVEETTRDRVKATVAQGLDEGKTNAEIADILEENDAFSSARAETIARTETAAADVAGNIIGWQESGVVDGKEWIVADAGECDLCQAYAGTIVPLDEEFEEGDPPLHPNCRCDVLPVLKDDEEE